MVGEFIKWRQLNDLNHFRHAQGKYFAHNANDNNDSGPSFCVTVCKHGGMHMHTACSEAKDGSNWKRNTHFISRRPPPPQAPRLVVFATIKTETLLQLLTHSLTPRSRVLLEKLTVSQPVKKFPAFYGTWRFITAFTSARHLFLS